MIKAIKVIWRGIGECQLQPVRSLLVVFEALNKTRFITEPKEMNSERRTKYDRCC